jgi:recombinational DNA repair protein RecR
MTEHAHELYESAGKLMRCSRCGEIADNEVEEIAVLTSRVQTDRILQEITIHSDYKPIGVFNDFAVYVRVISGTHETLTAERIGDKNTYRIVKKVLTDKEAKH